MLTHILAKRLDRLNLMMWRGSAKRSLSTSIKLADAWFDWDWFDFFGLDILGIPTRGRGWTSVGFF